MNGYAEAAQLAHELDAARRELADAHDALSIACNEYREQGRRIAQLEHALRFASSSTRAETTELRWLRLSHLALALELVEAERDRDAYAQAAAAPGTY